MGRKITEHKVRNLRSRESRYTLSEDGLVVEVFPSGRISLYAKYTQAGSQVKTKLGTYPALSVRDARARVRQFQSEANQKSTPKPVVSFRQFIDGDLAEWIIAHRRTGQADLDRLKHQFFPVFGDTRLRDITPQDVERYIARAGQHHKPATIKRNVSLLKRVFNLAVTWGFLRVSPACNVKTPSVDPRSSKLYLTEAEFSRLTAAVDRWEYLSHFGTPTEQRYHPLWFVVWLRVVLNTGARRGESLSLQWTDIDIPDQTITFQGTRTKNARTRSIPISNSLADTLRSYVPSDESLPVFPVASIKKPWTRLMTLSGLTITPHHLRHHVASTLVLRGVPLSVVRDVLGHSSLEVTSRYLSVRKQDKLTALNLL